ncbi:MAG: 1-acyl-sn-glycerol-3-phosphate acyltransferase [Rubrobacter sp.]|nr:1-acyl-sn-glycerol-3-phosphate acyltransferase [Rubrobacter sp.]
MSARKVSVGISPRYRLFRRFMLGVVGGMLGLRVHGAENVPASGALVVASNHRRYLDPVFISMAVPRRLQWMGKKELFVPPLDRFFYLIGSFPVDRKGGGRAALRTALEYLSQGAALGIFPEGTRRRAYDPEEAPKSGAVMLAVRSGAPMIPVYIGEVPGPLGRLRGEGLEVYIGEAREIERGTGGSGAYRAAADEILGEIYALPETFGEGE